MCRRGPAGVRLVVGFTSMDTVGKCARCAWRPGAVGGRGSLGAETKLDTERERGECAEIRSVVRCKTGAARSPPGRLEALRGEIDPPRFFSVEIAV